MELVVMVRVPVSGRLLRRIKKTLNVYEYPTNARDIEECLGDLQSEVLQHGAVHLHELEDNISERAKDIVSIRRSLEMWDEWEAEDKAQRKAATGVKRD